MALLLLTRNSAIYKAKQKPRQWGPLSAVRSAVFHNAERLGIDPASIVGLWPFWEGGGNTPINIANMKPPVSSDWTDVSWTGRGLYCNNTSTTLIDYLDYSTPSMDTYTLLWYGRVDALSAGDGNGMFDDDSGGTNRKFQFRISDSGLVVEFIVWPGPTFHTSSSAIDLGKDFVAAVACKNNDNVSIYLNGANEYTANGVSIVQTNNVIRLLNRKTTTPNSYVGAVYNAAIFGSDLTHTQIATLSEQPYALIQPVARPLVFDLGAGTVVTIGAGSLGLIGGSVYANRQAEVGSGTLSIVGSDVTNNVTMNIGAGSISLSGKQVYANRTTSVGAGSLSIPGADVNARKQANIGAGSLSITGSEVTTIANRIYEIGAGTLSLTGGAVTTLVGGLLKLALGVANPLIQMINEYKQKQRRG